MKIRWKFLSVMVAIAITPLLISAWLDLQRISHLGEELALQSGEAINQQSQAALQEVVKNYTRLINREAETLELIVRQQAREAERLLSEPRNDVKNNTIRIPWAHEFSSGATVNEYYSLDGAGNRIGVAVDLDSQTVYIAPGIERDNIVANAQALLEMNDFYRGVDLYHRDLIFWQYTALENGLQATFPGHGNYPDDFDPRKRPWFKVQKANPGLLWSPPHADAATGFPMANITMPILSPEGEFLGITGLDVRVRKLLRSISLPYGLDEGSKVVLAIYLPDENPETHDVFVVAEQTEVPGGLDWQDHVTEPRLTLDNPSHNARLDHDIQNREPGFFRTRWRNINYFCVYHPIKNNQTMLIFFVPVADLADPAMRTAQFAMNSAKQHINALLPFAAVLVMVILILAFVGSRRFVRPIKELVNAVNKVGEGDFSVRVNVNTGDELEQLGDALNTVIPQLEEHTRVRQELQVARAVQQRLLPDSAPNFDGIDISGKTIYCDHTGGDYYDFLPLPDHSPPQLGIALGDVSGHGIASSLMMATVRALLHGSAEQISSPSALLQHVNENLANDLHAGQFMTLFYLLADTESGRVTWADAGHDPAIRYDFANDEFSELSGQDIPLGVDHRWRYSEDSSDVITEKEVVLLGTDGIWETRSPSGEHFGKQRLREILVAAEFESAISIRDRVLNALETFRGDQPQHDDLTIVVFRFTPSV